MKTFLCFSLILLFSLICISSSAQIYRVQGGLNIARMYQKVGPFYSDHFRSSIGAHLGSVVEIPLNNNLSLETGILFTTKGYSIAEDKLQHRTRFYYSDLPLTMKLNPGREDFGFYGIFGGYVGLGLFGTHYSNWVDIAGETVIEKETVKWGTGDRYQFRRLDYGIRFGAGSEIKKLRVGVIYNLGLANISAHYDSNITAKNRVLQVSLGYVVKSE